ncbi:MAG: caspase-like protein [Gemmatimonadetes bacterium]|jgi:hypothetical protein|nr:caspase-like protein [Gemmatimonadota bacterium]
MTEQQQSDPTAPIPNCPKCAGPMWDNRVGKKNPKAPDFKCKDRECDGVIWPPRGATSTAAPAAAASTSTTPPAPGMPACPLCGGAMWDDRTSKRNPKAPDFKCRNKPKERGGPGCEGVIWPPRDGSPSPYPASAPRRSASAFTSAPPVDDTPFPNEPPPFDDDDLPF